MNEDEINILVPDFASRDRKKAYILSIAEIKRLPGRGTPVAWVVTFYSMGAHTPSTIFFDREGVFKIG